MGLVAMPADAGLIDKGINSNNKYNNIGRFVYSGLF